VNFTRRNIFHQRIEKRGKENATGYQKEIETRPFEAMLVSLFIKDDEKYEKAPSK
jgi:hypothetical protein